MEQHQLNKLNASSLFSKKEKHGRLVEQSWTATRCHRLLRPLQARIVAIDKISREESVSGYFTHKGNKSSKRPRTETNLSKQRKRLRYTYSQRKVTPPQSRREIYPISSGNAKPLRSLSNARLGHSPDGTALIDLPVSILDQPRDLDRSRVHSLSNENQNRVALGDWRSISDSAGEKFKYPDNLLALRGTISTRRYQVYKSIYHDLDNLMRATVARDSDVHKRSLLGMCIRQIPAYVKEMEKYHSKTSCESGNIGLFDTNISWHVYNELESLGSIGLGWKHLRIAARSHGLLILIDAVSRGLLDIRFTRILAQHYAQLACYEEATTLLCAAQDAACQIPLILGHESTGKHATEVLAALAGFAYHREGANFRVEFPLGYHMSIEDLRRVSSYLVNGILDQNCNLAATDFTITTISLLVHPPLPTVEQRLHTEHRDSTKWQTQKHTLTSLIGAMVATGVMYSENSASGHLPALINRRQAIVRRVVYIFEMCAFHDQSYSEDAQQTYHQSILSLATYLITTNSDFWRQHSNAQELLTAIWKRGEGQNDRDDSNSSDRHEFHDTTVTLISTAAQCCGLWSNSPPHFFLGHLCDIVAKLGLPSRWLKRVRVDSAFLLAQKTNDLQALAFAENLPLSPVAKDHPKAKVRVDETYFSGYRWEEGISEWIVATPPATKTVRFSCETSPKWNNDDKICYTKTEASLQDSQTITTIPEPQSPNTKSSSSGTKLAIQKDHNFQIQCADMAQENITISDLLIDELGEEGYQLTGRVKTRAANKRRRRPSREFRRACNIKWSETGLQPDEVGSGDELVE
jgi:hypothetical protein